MFRLFRRIFSGPKPEDDQEENVAVSRVELSAVERQIAECERMLTSSQSILSERRVMLVGVMEYVEALLMESYDASKLSNSSSSAISGTRTVEGGESENAGVREVQCPPDTPALRNARAELCEQLSCVKNNLFAKYDELMARKMKLSIRLQYLEQQRSALLRAVHTTEDLYGENLAANIVPEPPVELEFSTEYVAEDDGVDVVIQ